MAAIPGRAPKQTKPHKPHIMISGGSGVGKTWFGMDFPNTFQIDTEAGADLPHYQQKLETSGGRYFGIEDGSQDFDKVIGVVNWLAGNRHSYKSLMIDSFTKLYQLEAFRAAMKGGDEFGRDKKEANKPTRKLMQRLDNLDMNVIYVCHQKAMWKAGEYLGTTFDGFDKMEYDLHLWLEVVKRGPERVAVIRKSRLLGFPEGQQFPLTYAEFAQRYGVDIIEAEPVPVAVASAEQVVELERLIKAMNVPPETIEKWLDKAGVETLTEMPADKAAACIDFLVKQIQGNGAEPKAKAVPKAKPELATAK